MSDTLHFGWQDERFVLLVTNNIELVKHRISLTAETASRVRDCLEKGGGCAAGDDWDPVRRCHTVSNHWQVDTRDVDTVGSIEIHSLSEFEFSDKQQPIFTGKTSFGEGWLVAPFREKRAFSNGHFILCGSPPEDEAIAARSPNFDGVVPKERDESDTRLNIIAMQVLQHDDDFEYERRLVWFDRGLSIDGRYLKKILDLYPDAYFIAPSVLVKLDIPYLIVVDDAKTGRTVVGAMMPMNNDAPPLVVNLRARPA